MHWPAELHQWHFPEASDIELQQLDESLQNLLPFRLPVKPSNAFRLHLLTALNRKHNTGQSETDPHTPHLQLQIKPCVSLRLHLLTTLNREHKWEHNWFVLHGPFFSPSLSLYICHTLQGNENNHYIFNKSSPNFYHRQLLDCICYKLMNC